MQAFVYPLELLLKGLLQNITKPVEKNLGKNVVAKKPDVKPIEKKAEIPGSPKNGPILKKVDIEHFKLNPFNVKSPD